MSIAQSQVAPAPDCVTISDALQSYFESLSADSFPADELDLQIVSLDSNSIYQLQNVKPASSIKDVNFEKRMRSKIAGVGPTPMSQVLLNSQGIGKGEADEFPETQHFVRRSSLGSFVSTH